MDKGEQKNSNFAIVKNCFRQELMEHYISNFNDLHLLILVYMQRFRAITTNTMTFCLGWLHDDLGIKGDKAKQNIIKSLFELQEMALIQLNDLDIDKVIRNTRIITSLSNYENNFTLVDNDAINKIFGLDLDIRQRRTMLFLYIDLASRIDGKGYCYPSYNILKRDINTTSDNRIFKALKLLKEHGLIDYDNPGQVVIDEQVTQANNIYVLCNDENYKAKLQQGLSNRKKQLEEGKAKICRGLTSNKMTSLKLRKNNLDKKYYDKTITDNELHELEQIENDYYELNKLNKDKLKKIDFITINTKEKELQGLEKKLRKLKDKEYFTEQEEKEVKELLAIYIQLKKELGGE